MSALLRTIPSLLILIAVGCGTRGGPPRNSTHKVTGTVIVDGQPPMSSVQLTCHPTQGMNTKFPATTNAISDPDGKFAFSTYESGDGVPPGEYIVTIAWREFNPVQMSFGGPDRLNGRYSDPAKSEIKLTVTDSPIDLGELQLKTE